MYRPKLEETKKRFGKTYIKVCYLFKEDVEQMIREAYEAGFESGWAQRDFKFFDGESDSWEVCFFNAWTEDEEIK